MKEKTLIPCNNCQGGGCPVCCGSGLIIAKMLPRGKQSMLKLILPIIPEY